MKRLKLPNEHLKKISYFINELSRESKEMLFDELGKIDADFELSEIVDYLDGRIDGVEKDNLIDIITIYERLIGAKNAIDASLDEFISLFEKALIETKASELTPNEEVLDDFRKLLSSNKNIETRAKVIEVITEQERVFFESNIYQDLRTIFGEDGNIEASVIIHNLKIEYKEDNRIKELFFALDNNDLAKLAKKIKKAQEQSEVIKKAFPHGNFLEL